MARKSSLEALIAAQIRGARLPEPARNFVFHPGRKWQLDFAWVSLAVALEVQGGTWVKGGHSRGLGYERDCEKLNAAQLGGWVVVQATTNMVHDGRALDTIREAIECRSTAFAKP